MNVFRTLGKIGAAAFLYFGVLRGASALYLGIKDYYFQSISLTQNSARFIVTFLINNPLFVGLTLKSISGDVYIQGNKCGTVNVDYDKYLAGRQAWSVAVPVDIDLSQLTASIIDNINTGNINTLTIAFDGGIIIGGTGLVRIPFAKTVTWNDISK